MRPPEKLTAINQIIIVLGINIVLIVGTLGFDWADTLFPSAEAHGAQEQLQSRFIRIENETFNRQIMQTGDVLTIQGQLVSLVERDLRGWVTIFTEFPEDRWEMINSLPLGVFDIAGNSVVPYSVSVRALGGGVHHVHTLLYVEEIGPGLGPGTTVVVEGEPVEGEPITIPAPPDSTATAVTIPPGGSYDDLPMIQIDLEAEASALAEGYDLRQIANVSGLLPDTVVAHEVLARDSGATSLEAIYTQYPSDLELPDTVVLAIQLWDRSYIAGTTVQILEHTLSNATPDIMQEIESGLAEAFGSTGEADVTEWTTDPLDAANLGDDAFRLALGGSVEDQEFHAQLIWFSRDSLTITVHTVGLSEEDAMAVAAELDSRAAQMVQPEPVPIETPIVPTPLQQYDDGGTDSGDKTPAFISVGAGERHTCGVRGDRNVECWGDDRYGQSTPPEGTFLSVSTGERYTCGVRGDGNVECWGSNQRQDGFFVNQATPPEGTFVSVSAGYEHACGVRDDGAVECWGSTEDGRTRSPEGAFASVSAGERHTCGVRDDGTAECWGENHQGQARPPEGTFVSVSAGYGHTCGVRDDGTAECWGENHQGQARPPEGTFVSVSAGYGHTCGVRDDGTAECWGSNRSYGYFAGQARPPGGSFVSIDAGDFHACGVRDDGAVECWGENRQGQAIPLGFSFNSVSAGHGHTCGVRDDGTVECWGSNENEYDPLPARPRRQRARSYRSARGTSTPAG